MHDATSTFGFLLLALTSMLAIVNPLSAVPLFLTITAGYAPARRRQMLHAALLTSVAVLFAFGLLGTFILQFFGITTNAFRLTGGILFLGIGSDMLQAKRSRAKTTEDEDIEAEAREDVGVIPLGMPTLAGPGAITTVITLEAQARTPAQSAMIYVAILAVLAASWAVLSIAPLLFRRFGRTGLNVMTRIMGLIVMVIGMQFLIDGVRAVADAMRS